MLIKVDLLQDGKLNPKRVVKPGMDLVNIKLTLDNMATMLHTVVEYVERVMVRRTANGTATSGYDGKAICLNVFSILRMVQLNKTRTWAEISCKLSTLFH